MSFYTGVVPADGLSAETGINRSLQQTRTNLQSPTSVRATSNSGSYAAPLTPAQAYARTFVSEQPVLQYTIERQQLEKPSDQQPGPNLQSLIGVSAPTRGQSYAQRLYASSLSKRPQAQTHQQPTNRQPSFERGESSKNRVPAGPRAPYGARASLMLNADHTNAPQTVPASDFYHNSIAKLDFQLPQPVPERGTNSSGLHPQSAAGSAPSIPLAHSPVPIQVPHDLQAPSRRSPVPVELSDGSPPSPAGDPRRSNQAGLHSRNPPTTHVIPGSSTSSDIPLRPESVNNAIASPVPPETLPRESSSYSQDCSRGVVATTSNPESVTRPGDPSPAPIQIESFDVGSSEEVPLYSLVDDGPPPPDFDESQSMCSAIRASTYHAEPPVVLSLPDVPSLTPHESDSVSGAVPSTGADALSFVRTPRALSLEPLSGSPQTSLAIPEVASYPTGKAPEDVKEKSYNDSTKDSMPKFSERSSSMEASSSFRILSEQVPSYRQSRYNTAPQDIPHPSSSPPGPPHNNTPVKTPSTAPPPALPLRNPVVSTPATSTASAPPHMMPASPLLSPKVSAVKPAEVRTATSSPLRPSSSHRPSNSSLLPRVSAEPTFPPSSSGTPPFMAASAGITSQMYYAGSPSPLSSPPLSQRSRGPSVLSASATGSRPAEFRPQLSPDVSSTLQGQAPYQSPRETFQPPTEFRPQLSPAVSHTLQGYPQAPYQSPQSFQPQAFPPPPPQDARAITAPTQPVQSSRGLGINIATGLAAGGVLGLLGGAVLAETLDGGDIVDDITGSMDGMTFGNPADSVFDPNMGTGNILGNGFDATAIFQGNQTFDGDSLGQTYNVSDQTTGNGVDFTQFQGQIFDVSQLQQQPNNQSNQSSDTHYLHDAGKLLQAAYKMYNTSHKTNATQGSQSSQTTAPPQQTLASTMSGISNIGPNSPPIEYTHTSMSIPFHGRSADHFTASGYPSPTQQTGQPMHPMASQTAQLPTATAFSQHLPSFNPASQQGTHSHHHASSYHHTSSHPHHHTSSQSFHTSHTQSPYTNNVTYPSSGTATHTMYSQGQPIPAQHVVNHGHGTTPHHAYPPQSQAGPSVHPVQHHAPGNMQQQPPNNNLDKTMLAKKFVKGALMAGGVLAKYNRLSGGNGFVGNSWNGQNN
ncbi:uncharacterized protein HD556DRAFT_1448512 [Suillus plorans]|uniref:Uncharacterized protein n=1 Tax=Suillus plorans TaxID=116603 RepID=A0A9P7AEA3_9AGAM|nr:uncharacterized protein HD556DRAFT_1448512 [Suillus plorans]KAG1787664.1 hypothetical protein HD556DRAFT_1448512 [Suillus plorans]